MDACSNEETCQFSANPVRLSVRIVFLTAEDSII